MFKKQSHLCLGGHGARGHAHRVDSSAGVLMDLDVGLLLHVPRRIKQVKDLLVVELWRVIEGLDTRSKVRRKVQSRVGRGALFRKLNNIYCNGVSL